MQVNKDCSEKGKTEPSAVKVVNLGFAIDSVHGIHPDNGQTSDKSVVGL
jgi:hypothetical protein